MKFSRLPVDERIVAEHSISFQDPPVILVKNSKAGCTTLAQIMYFSQTGKFLEGKIHTDHEILTQGWKTADTNLARIRDGGRFLFTSVRHPEDRAYSAFLNLIFEGKNRSGRRHNEAIRSFGFDPNKSESYNFDVFLEYVDQSLQKDRYRTDRHWREQSINTGIDLFAYDLVCRLENLSEDIPTILEHLCIPKADWDEIRHARFNRSSKENPVGTPAQRRNIQRIYKNDY